MTLPQLSASNIAGKKVIVRFDGDVPTDQEGKKILDDYRLKAVLPTLKHCLSHSASIILIAHRGRPDGRSDPVLSNKIIADYFAKVLDEKVDFIPDLRSKPTAAHIAVLELRARQAPSKRDF